MSNAIIDTSILTEIADAVRDKTGETAPIKLGEMAQAIESIQTGGGGDAIKLLLGAQNGPERYAITASDLTGITELRQYAFYGSVYLSSAEIPEGCKKIGDYAMNNNAMLVEITLPSTITSIGANSIRPGSNVNKCTLYCKAVSPPKIANTTIGTYVTTIYVPSGSVDAYKSATNWSSLASRIQAMP